MSSRREFGSIATVRPGVQRVRYWADLHDGTGYRRRSATVRGTKREAAAWLAKQHVEHGGDVPDMTVSEVYETWYLPDIEERLADRTLYIYKSAWESKLAPRWGDVPVGDVKPRDVQEWLLGMKLNAAKLCMKIFPSIMDYAARYELVASNPLRVKYRMPSDVESMDAGIYTLNECRLIADAVRGTECEAAYILAAFGSCRPGEALGVTCSDVSAVEASNGMVCAVVEIQRQIDQAGNVVESVKNRQSRRTVVIPEPWSLRLLEIAEGCVWLTGGSQPVGVKALSAWWKGAVEGAGLAFHLFRNLRRSWRTYMSWELDAEPEKLEKLMGHAGTSVTDRHYNKPKTGQLVEAVAQAFAKLRNG